MVNMKDDRLLIPSASLASRKRFFVPFNGSSGVPVLQGFSSASSKNFKSKLLLTELRCSGTSMRAKSAFEGAGRTLVGFSTMLAWPDHIRVDDLPSPAPVKTLNRAMRRSITWRALEVYSTTQAAANYRLPTKAQNSSTFNGARGSSKRTIACKGFLANLTSACVFHGREYTCR